MIAGGARRHACRWGIIATVIPGLATCALAQPGYDAHFRHLTTRDGLPYDVVRALAMDRHGFLWAGTDDGLARFDGTGFRNFHHSRKDTGTLVSNSITHLALDRDGGIWCATRNGVSRYDPAKDAFRHLRSVRDDPHTLISPSISELHVDAQDNIWVCSWEGLCVVEAGGSRVQRLPQQAGWFKDKRAVSAYRDRRGYLWAGTLGGLYRIAPDLRSAEPIAIECPLPKDASGLRVIDILEDGEGVLWLSTWGSGLVRYDPRTGAAACYLPRPERAGDGAANVCAQALVTDYPGEEHLLWVASLSDGLLRFDKRTGTFTHFAVTDPASPKFITSDVKCLFDNGAGELFAGTANGLLILSRSRQLFRDMLLPGIGPKPCLTAILTCHEDPADSGRTLWLGTWSCGTYALDRRTGALTPERALHGSSPSGEPAQANFFHHDPRHGFFAGMTHGLFRRDERTRRWQPVTARTPDGASVDLSRAECAMSSTDGSMLIGGNGLVFLDTRTNLAERVDLDALARQQGFERIVPLGGISRCIERPQGVFWLLCDRRYLVRYNHGQKRIAVFRNHPADGIALPGGHTWQDLVQDADGRAWLSSEAGLAAFDANAAVPSFRHVGREEGLPSEVIGAMAVDRAGRLWMATHRGLACLTPATGQVRTCIAADGLLLPRVGQVALGAFSGEVIVLADAAVQVLDLGVFDRQRPPAPIRLTGIQVLNRPYQGKGAPFIQDTINLTYDQKEFSFSFVSLDMAEPEPPFYEYMLEGSSDEWVPNGRNNTASFMNLPGGAYRFLVRARSADGTVSAPQHLITVIVHPPFWATAWFYAAAALLLVGGIVLYNRFRLRALQARNAALERSVDRRTAELRVQVARAERSEQAKQQFLANMSHEIRTPMNAIMGMTAILKREPHSPAQRHYLEAIAQSSENLLVIINDILDLSKLESGRVELERVAFDPRAVLEHVLGILRFKAGEKGLALGAEVAPEVPPRLLGDPTRLGQILLNLIGNAVKFTERGSVGIVLQQCRADDSSRSGTVTLSIEVRDTGIGIPEDRLATIFEEFTQASSDTTRKYGGTGLGLTISKRLAGLMGGSISVRSAPGQGSTFTVLLPFAVAPDENAAAAPMHGSAAPAELSGLRILLAEDNTFNAMVAQDELAASIPGVEVTVAANGRIAVDLVRANDYDLVLMDVQMPELNGYDATRAIRALGGAKGGIPIVAMTANVLKEEVDRCHQAGMDAYVPKPFTREQLMSAVEAALRKPMGGMVADAH
jgi:signal transduction histidine kinase/ligand-binding sensor domain-containing protein